jgi:hypothetical protein
MTNLAVSAAHPVRSQVRENPTISRLLACLDIVSLLLFYGRAAKPIRGKDKSGLSTDYTDFHRFVFNTSADYVDRRDEVRRDLLTPGSWHLKNNL